MIVDGEFILYGISSANVDEVFPQIKPFLESSTQYSDGAFTPSDILKAVKQKEMQLWVVAKDGIIYSAVITEVKLFPSEQHLNILFLSGNQMTKWIHLIKDLIARAKENKCDAVKVYGRRGWIKILNEYGFKESHVVLKLDL